MDLDNLELFKQLDPQGMLAEIDALPGQLWSAWQLGQNLELPENRPIHQMVIAGMGGSAIGGDFLAAYADPLGSVPIVVHRDYSLPAWANTPETLVVVSSHSGNTEETVTSFEEATRRGCPVVAITTGGQLAEAAPSAGAWLWRFEHSGQPRAAIGYSFGLLLALAARLGVIPDPERELREAISSMKEQQATLRASVPVVKNPAKRMAGQLMDRWVAVFGSGILAPVARRWKAQISENAKAWAQFEYLPEADHNTLAGVLYPEALLSRTMMIFLVGDHDLQRNRLRAELTRKTFMLEGLNTDFVQARGASRLANLWTSLHFGDYTSYYLAMAYQTDPTRVDLLESFKKEMSAHS